MPQKITRYSAIPKMRGAAGTYPARSLLPAKDGSNSPYFWVHMLGERAESGPNRSRISKHKMDPMGANPKKCTQ